MQDQGIAGLPGASVPSGSASGLGVCDVWRLELSAGQWPWLADELDELRGPLEEELQRARMARERSGDPRAFASDDRVREGRRVAG